MGNISSLIASELLKKINLERAKDKKAVLKNFNNETIGQTILQLNSIPFVIEINQYKNAHSSANPTGDYRAAYQFALLSDTIPLLFPTYVDSLNSVSKIWGNIVNNANAFSKYSQAVFENARNSYNFSKLSGFGGIPEDWYNVQAKPSDWVELLDSGSNLVEIEIDLADAVANSEDFLILSGNDSNLSWKIFDSHKNYAEIPLNVNSKITRIYLKLLRVDFYRSWLNFEILNNNSWKIDGLDKGYFSNGSLIGNKGSFPLIPQSVLIGSRIEVEGNFDPTDREILSSNRKTSENVVCMGTFVLNNIIESPKSDNVEKDTMILTSDVKQVIGYISRLIPESPPLSGE
ncbi:hypothetical protein [Flavobacterium sp. FlaQc-50]|uniref:hypothetical protein n=1 Tax=unclassified Flavobacterium TaxID=196869 RepID=UPI003757B83D